ncbi:MAG: diguanylate cyclase [Treponema sp.]|jgi:diguanylate cyclase (GGDEF)-like protein|nr:diguanylate cyclase [Treponema sp.]
MNFSLVFLNVFSLVFLSVTFILSLYRRRLPGAGAFCLLVFTAFLWSFGSFAEQIASSFAAKLFWRNLTQLGTFFLPVAALVFVLSYSGVSSRIRRLAGVFLCCWQIVPLFFIFSDSALHYMRASVTLCSDISGYPFLLVRQTVFGMICISFNYVLMIAAISILLVTAYRKPAGRRSLLIIAGGIAVPCLVSGLNNAFGSRAFGGIPVSTSFAFLAFIILISFRNFGFLMLTPAARDRAFDVIDEGILVSAADGSLVDMNPAARVLLARHYALPDTASMAEFGHCLERTLGENISTLCTIKKKCFSLPLPDSGEIIYYEIRSYELRNKKTLIGYTGVLHDVTDETNRMCLLSAKIKRDPFTGIYNKQAFTEIVGKLLEQVPSEGGCLMVFDIDRFKAINDSYGHLAGDAVLKFICERCQNVLRSGDIFGRVGGDEFALFFKGIDNKDALNLAERIRMTVSSEQIELAAASLSVSISAGTACTASTRSTKICKTFDELFARADAALYRSKRLGRNRIMTAESV